jgi:arylsulfatase A-like enzyme
MQAVLAALIGGAALGLIDASVGLLRGGFSGGALAGMLGVVALHQLLLLVLVGAIAVLFGLNRQEMRRRWLTWRGVPPGGREATQALALMTQTLFAVAGIVAAAALVSRLSTAFNTALYVAIAQVLGTVLCCVFTWLVGRQLSSAIARRSLPLPLSRWRVTAAALGLGVLLFFYLVWRRDLLFKEVDPWLALALPLHVVAAFAIVWIVDGLYVERRWPWWVAVALLPGVAFGLSSWAPSQGLVVRKAPVSALIMQELQPLSDFDGDGVSGLFGGGDCAPFNPRIYPGAVELPDDGIDQDCLAGDLVSAAIQPTAAPKFVELPADQQADLIVLVSVDALRADRLGTYGYKKHRTSPNLDRWASAGQVFENGFTTGPYTIAALPGLLTSRGISQVPNYVATKGSYRLDKKLDTIAERLKLAGYKTHAVLTGLDLDKNDFAQGIEAPNLLTKKYEDSADRTVAAARTWLEENPTGKRFLWLHFFDPHDPYFVIKGKDFGSSSSDRYDASIAFMDEHLGPLLSELSAAPKTAVALVADHGEAFGEHGAHHHGMDLYNPNVRVPFILRASGFPAGRTSMAVSLLDVLPTLLNLAGAPSIAAFGQSLVPQLQGVVGDPERGVLTESYRKGQLFSYSTENWRLIYDLHANRFELYDQRNDRAEASDRYALEPDRAQQMTEALVGALSRGVWVRRGLRVKAALLDEVPAEALLPRPQRFGDDIELVGYRWSLGGKKGKPAYEARFYWRALRPIREPWHVAVGLHRGKKVINKDHVPVAGYFPPTLWPVGAIVEDKITPGRLHKYKKGDWEVTVGLYNGKKKLLPVSDGPLPLSRSKTRVVADQRTGVTPIFWTR